MFLHIGDKTEVLLKDIVAIINMGAMGNNNVKGLNENLIHEKFYLTEKKEDIKSIIILKKDNKNIIYFSPINSLTLLKRYNILIKYQKNFQNKELHK